MKSCFLLITILLCLQVVAQKVSYTHRTTRVDYHNGVIVVPQIGGKHHLVVVPEAMPARLVIYNSNMDLEQELQLPFKFSTRSDITIVPLKNEYYLYNEGYADTFSLYKISAVGKVSDETHKLRSVIKSAFAQAAKCQVFSVGDKIYLLGSHYYRNIRKIITTVLQLSSNLEQEAKHRLPFDFEYGREAIQRMVLIPGKNLIVLKRQRSDEGQNILNVVKVNMQTGKSHSAAFTSSVSFSAPDILYNHADSSTTVYTPMSRVHSTPGYERSIFFAALTDSFYNKQEATVVKFPLKDPSDGAFTLINISKECNKWIPVLGVWNASYQPRNNLRVFVDINSLAANYDNTYVTNATSYRAKLQSLDTYTQLVLDPGNVRFSVLNDQFKQVADTVIKYRRKNFIEVSQYTSFTIKNNDYLLVKEQFPSNGKGLLLLYANNNRVNAASIHLYDKYQYSLPQVQHVGNNLFIPYLYKGELGMATVELPAREYTAQLDNR